MRGSHTTSRPRSVSLRIRRAGALLQRNRRVGNEVFVERRCDPGRFESLDPGLDQRIVGRWKRQLVDQHALQRIAGNVDALPEALRTDQHATRGCVRNGCSSARLGCVPCTSTSMCRSPQLRAALRKRLGDQRQRAQRGRQHEGAAAECGRAARRQRRRRRRRGPARWVWETASARTAARMRGVVERAAQAQLDGIFEAGRRGEPAQVVVVAQRGRREDPGLARRATAARSACRECPAATRPAAPAAGRHRSSAHGLRRRRVGTPRPDAPASTARSCSLAKSGAEADHRLDACRRCQRTPQPSASRRATKAGWSQRSVQRSLTMPRNSRRVPAAARRRSRAARLRRRPPVPASRPGRAPAASPSASRSRAKSMHLAACPASCRGTARRPRRAGAPRRTPRRRRSAATRPRRCRAAPCRRRRGGD